LLPEGYLDRLQAAMQKSIREERIHSGWIAPNEEYEAAVRDFISDALDPVRSEAFLNSFQPFAKRVAKLGMQNSLAQLVLKLTSPGVPDIYQGCDLWNFSFVDPDNRRAVDYEVRAHRLREIRQRLAADKRTAMRDYFEKWEDGSIKLAILSTLLNVRRELPALFGITTYEPISCSGPGAQRVCAFSRSEGMSAMIVAVKLYPATSLASGEWEQTHLPLPGAPNGWIDVLTLQQHRASNGSVAASAIFGDLPVVVLLASTEAVP
jgi:(1->4)-alpha-D-glucan 1-alpha-D-glucosylmutase